MPMVIDREPDKISGVLRRRSRVGSAAKRRIHRMADLDERQTRAAQNEALFRAINERIDELAGGFAPEAPASDWVCECANTSCAEIIEVSPAVYERVRQDGTRFVVAPSPAHVLTEAENVVAREERYWVVEKIGVAEVVAEDLDPRS